MFYLDIGSGIPLVLIHGLGSTKESWMHQLSLSNKYRLIIPDLRGHGESTNFENISIRTFTQDVLELLDSLDIQKAHFCGLSMGGLVVQQIMTTNPRRMLSATLCNTFSYTPYSMGYLALSMRKEKLNSLSTEDYILETSKNCLYDAKPEHVSELSKTFKINKEAYITSSESAIRSNFLMSLPFSTTPTLIIGSSHDQVVPMPSFLQTRMFIPFSDLVILKNCGHVSNFDKKDEFNNTLSSFLSNCY